MTTGLISIPIQDALTQVKEAVTGCGAVWIARSVWDAEVEGSNPLTPTIDEENEN